MNRYDLNRLRAHVEQRLSPQRCHHSLCVQEEALRLARIHGADEHKAAVAGLLHDVCKSMPEPEQLKYLEGNAILIDMPTREHPPVWHSVAGAVWARRELGIEDEDILAAIRYHTTGRAGMSLLEQVVYLADVTSEDRRYPDISHYRALAERSPEEGMRYVLAFNVTRLVQQGKTLLQDTWEAYNQYTRALGADDKRSDGWAMRGCDNGPHPPSYEEESNS